MLALNYITLLLILFTLVAIFIVARDIYCILRRAALQLPTGGEITQLTGDLMPGAGSNSIQAGLQGTFQASFTPSGSAVPPADTITFTSSDAGAVVASSPDGDPTKCVVNVSAADVNPSFVLTCTLSGPDFPAPVVLTPLTVAILPNLNLPTGGTINQLS